MDLTGGGTVIMLAIAAGLWFLYLVPTWFRRREYLATERTATRLQQTMRIMAETAEVPEAVRFAATARDAARAERLLRARQRREDAMVARAVRAERAATPSVAQPPRMLATVTTDALKRRRMRRTRLFASVLMIAATVVALVQIWLMATTGTSWGGWLILAGTLTAGGAAVGVQRRLDVMAMPRRTAPVPQTRVRVSHPLIDDAPARPTAPAPWTPAPMPKPLYLSKPAPQRVTSTLPVVEPFETRAPAEVIPMRQDPPPAVRTSGFAAMGIVDPADTAAPDLDEVLRRRRSAG